MYYHTPDVHTIDNPHPSILLIKLLSLHEAIGSAGTVLIPVEEIPHHSVGTGILILGYIIVITSWIGYSLSAPQKAAQYCYQ
jgi:hypothetical protein